MISKFVIGALLLSFNAQAFEKSKVRAEMQEISDILSKVYPYLYSKSFTDDKNEMVLLRYLEGLNKHFDKASSQLDKSKSSNFISANVLKSHLKETYHSYKSGYKLYSQKMMQALPNLCFSCHSRDGISSLAVQKVQRKSFESDFEFAEFNYMTRNYERASKYYDKVITSSANHPAFETLADKAFERKLSLHIRAFNSSKKDLLQFTKLLDRSTVSKKVKTKVKSWIEILESKSSKVESIGKIGFRDFQKKYLDTKKELPHFIAGAKEKIHYLRLHNELEKFFAKGPEEKFMPEVLYWLGYIDGPLNKNLFYSLSEIYLKECMLSYSKHPYAKKCFKEYEEAITFSYSGSAGTFIPDDTQKELNDFKKLIGL